MTPHRLGKLALATTLAASALLLSATSAIAQLTTLRTVSAFQKGTAFAAPFEKMMDRVNADPDAPIRFDYIGGPETTPPLKVGNAIKRGVIDAAVVTGAFYTNLMPEANALRLSERAPQELRASGAWDSINAMFEQGMNVHWLAFTGHQVPFYLYLTKPVTGTDLSGLKLRVTPVYQAFFQALGATTLQTPPGEVYTALQRGVVDGYGWPLKGIFDLGWQEQTKYRVDPGFYSVEVSMLINLDAWNKLSAEQQAYLTEQATWLEEQEAQNNPRITAEEIKRQEDAGIQTITLSGEDQDKYLATAARVGWEEILAQSPSNGAKLKELLTQ